MHAAWWGREIERMLSALAEAHDLPMVVGGDFNMPSDDSTMAALRANFRFAFEDAGWGYGYTRPARLPWVRIDHILAGPEWYAVACRVGPDFGSDHLPVFAELELAPKAR
jgi:endonuclease/exonuclease/phosphatase family metal-dependent hydrolase